MKRLLAIWLTIWLLPMFYVPDATAEMNMNKGTMLVQYCTANYELNKVLIDPAGGMGYVIRTENGELFVIDGGNENDGYRFLQLLQEISGEEKPRVSMWFLSHPHGDHYGALKSIADEYADCLTIDKLLCSFPPHDTVDLNKSTSYASGSAALTTILTATQAELVTPHTGETYQLDNLTIDIVTTWEDLQKINDPNETSTVLMVYAEGQKMLFLGDAYPATAQNVLDNYGDKLACDIVQVAHHGINGCKAAVYEKTGAMLYLLPANQLTMDAMQGKYVPSTWVFKNAPELIVGGNGTSYIPLPYHPQQ